MSTAHNIIKINDFINPYNYYSFLSKEDLDNIYIDTSTGDCNIKIYINAIESKYNHFEPFLQNSLGFVDDYYLKKTNFLDYKAVIYNVMFFGLNVDYFYFVKKLYGSNIFFRYKKQVDPIMDDLTQYSKIILDYESDDYFPIKNHIMNVTGYVLYIEIKRDYSLYGYFVQKKNDYEKIQVINGDSSFPKLLN